MELKNYIKAMKPDERERFASLLGTSVGYLYQLSGNHRKPGALMAKNIEKVTQGVVSAVSLRPDYFGD